MAGIKNPLSVDPSYRRISILFKLLGVSPVSSPIYLHLGVWVVFQLFLIEVLRINKYKLFSVLQILFLLFITIMYGIYFNTLSKDLVLIFFLLIFFHFYIYSDNLNYLIIFIGMYSLFFRQYWVILLIFSLYIRMMKQPKIKRSIIYIILLFIVTIVIYDLFNGGFITNIRESMNQERIIRSDPNIRSIIMNIIPNTNIINDVFNYLYILITLFIPIQGIKSFNVIVYYIWIIGVCIFIIKFRKQVNLKLLLILFSFVNIQALFEPDLGSAFRHQLSLFPLIYYLLSNAITKERNIN